MAEKPSSLEGEVKTIMDSDEKVTWFESGVPAPTTEDIFPPDLYPPEKLAAFYKKKRGEEAQQREVRGVGFGMFETGRAFDSVVFVVETIDSATI